MKNSFRAALLGILFFCILFNAKAQQNHSLFLWNDVQQSNLLNPAIPISCKWYIGMPVLSSVHVNYANNGFTFNQLFTKSNEGLYNPDLDWLKSNLHRRNFMGTEIHTQLFALGYRYGEYSFLFGINEKNNLPITYPKDLMLLILDGNAPFIGDKVGAKGTGVYFNHYREYSFGITKINSDGLSIGLKAKVLFGKLNLRTKSTDVSLFTDQTTYNLEFEGDVIINSSLPIIVEAEDNTITNIELDNSISPINLIMNGKNPGFAIDAGITYPYNDKLEFSASVLDLGFIRWRSNLNTFDASGNFSYEGVLSDDIPTDNYFRSLQTAFLQNMNLEVYHKKYTTFLPPKAMLGAKYKYRYWLNGGVVGDVIYYKSKLMPSVTVLSQLQPTSAFGLMVSYTVQNYSLNNLGLGLFLRKNPLQFYIVSDNALAVLKPLDTRMTNVRFGLNINFGCKERKEKSSTKGYSSGNCYGMNNNQKAYMKKLKPWSKRNKNK